MSGAPITTIAVLAGGLATRMRPATETLPKAMLDVAGEPFVAHQLRLFKREGLRRVVMCLGYRGEQVVEFVGDGARFGLEVVYSFDGDRLLGTGGALRKALPQLDDPFFVIYGDSYLDIPYAPLIADFAASGRDALVTVFHNEDRWDTSNIVFDGRDVLAYSKTDKRPEMHYIDYGLGILRAATLLTRAADKAFDLGSVYEELAGRGQLAGREIQKRFYEIGSQSGLAETGAYLAAQQSAYNR